MKWSLTNANLAWCQKSAEHQYASGHESSQIRSILLVHSQAFCGMAATPTKWFKEQKVGPEVSVGTVLPWSDGEKIAAVVSKMER